QFLQRLERPAAEQITGIPPAVAVTHKSSNRSNRSTVGTVTETNDYLRLLLAKIGRVICQTCEHEVCRETPQSAAELLTQLPSGTRFLVAFEQPSPDFSELKSLGFFRIMVGDRQINLAETENIGTPSPSASIYVVIDRLTAGAAVQRVRESLEA